MDTGSSLTTPVLFLIFNRPDTTRKVFEAIRKVRPEKLFIAADGPRINHNGETKKCEETRSVLHQIDWDCEVKTLFRDHNLGCGRGVSEAINWFFTHVDEGIILEDDCLPSDDFFRFCNELLAYYRDDFRVMQIGGNNLLKPNFRDNEYSYTFSNHNYIWGWATWKRAWQFYNYDMKYYSEIKDKQYDKGYFSSFDEAFFFNYVFQKIHYDRESVNTWDYQWQFSRMLQNGLSIVPGNNLVVNLGFGEQSTHTSNPHSLIGNLALEGMRFPLKHPQFMMVYKVTDMVAFRSVFTTRWSRIKSRLKDLLPARLSKMISAYSFRFSSVSMIKTGLLVGGDDVFDFFVLL